MSFVLKLINLSIRENYLLAKTVEKLGTPVKMELDKLRQVAEERTAQCNKGLAGVLGINGPSSSPLNHLRSSSTVASSCPMSEVSFKPGMSVYRPGGSGLKTFNTEQHCPPTPTANEGKRSRLSSSSEFLLGNKENSESVSNLNARFTEALEANTIPFSPARASSQGINLIERETCPKKLASRQKQIDYGKNTGGYLTYVSQVQRNQRKRGDHPWTPNKFQLCSKRSWDGQVRKWRRALHKFDPNETAECDESIETESNQSIQSGESL